MAHISEWRVRETTLTEGTADLVLAGPMYGSSPFLNAAIMAIGDTCDYVAHYGTVSEAGLGTMAAGGTFGTLQRTTVYRSRHANGDINTTKVSLPVGVKTVIMSSRAGKMVRVDLSQSFSAGETAQHRANAPPFPSGTRLIFQQTAAPVGWTKDLTSHNDKILRFTTGAASFGGVLGFSTVFSQGATGSHALTLSELATHDHGGASSGGADHSHPYFSAGSPTTVQSGSGASVAGPGFATNTGNASAFLHTHVIPTAGSGAGHTHPMDIRVQYADAIIAVAN